MGEPEHDDEGPLIRVAEAISDGAPVDWERESLDHAGLRSKLGRLRLLEAIASAHRASPPAPAAGSASSNPAATTVGLTIDGRGATAGDPLAFPSQWGPLRILEKLGEGGFGEVYRAYDPKLQLEVALKLRRPGKTGTGRATRDFIDEARRLARVKHANVLVVHGADEHDGRVGLWTDLLEGKTLERCLKEQGTFGAHEAALIGIDLCGALAAVHSAGLAHRDVKTFNVMREEGGRIVLMDFGSASEATPEASPNQRSERAGTAMAMAPEVLLHGEAPSRAADIYGLGVLLYRLVSGQFPIEANSLPELVEKHRRGELVPLRDVRPNLPAAFVQVVERALASDPARRYPSAGAMEQALVASLGAVEREPTLDPWWRGLGWTHYAAAAAMAVVLSLALWALWPRPMTVEASLFRENAGARETLRSGARVRIGDHLSMELTASKQANVYVINEDASGTAFVLFPAGLDLENPLPPRIRVQLPGRLAGIEQHWVLTSAGGSETILVIVSEKPLREIEETLADMPRAQPGRPPVYHQIEPQDVGRIVRGIGGMAPSTVPQGAAPGRLKDLAKLLPETSESVGGVWVHQFELENPGR